MSRPKSILKNSVPYKAAAPIIPAPSPKIIAPALKSNEFSDDDDDDLFASVDLAQITAKYASQPKPKAILKPAIAPHRITAPPPANRASAPSVAKRPVAPTIDLVSDDDEFGDGDLDGDDFAAVEAATTQAYRASGQVSGSVGRLSRL
jgi:hypothetical protein